MSKFLVIFLCALMVHKGVECYSSSRGVSTKVIHKNVVKNYGNSETGNVSMFSSYTYRIDPTLITGYVPSSTRLKLNASVDTEAPQEFPVFVSFIQRHEAVHLQLPFVSRNADGKPMAIYRSASRTLCIPHAPQDELESQILVTISSGSPQPIGFRIKFIAEDNFQVLLGKPADFKVTPASPTFAYFPIRNNTGQNVVIRVSSDNSLCMAIAVQKPKCPVLDAEDTFGLRNNWEIVSYVGAVRVNMREFLYGFYIKIILLENDFLCGESSEFGQREKSVSILVDNDLAVSTLNGDFWFALGVPLISSLIVGIVIGTVYIISYVLTRNTIPACRTQDTKKELMNLVSLEKFSSSGLNGPANFGKWTVFVSLFFAIPVVDQSIYNTYNGAGIFGMCSHNDLCSHQLWNMKGFNHIWANTCYLVLGLVFILITLLKKWAKQKPDENEGIQFHVGLFYSMGLALIVKGVLGSAYHFCPSDFIFQYDLMYLSVIVAICLLKVFETRRPNSLNVDSSCGILAVILLISASGIAVERYFPEEASMWFRIAVAVIHGLVACYGSVYAIYIGYPINRLAKALMAKEEMPLHSASSGTKKDRETIDDDLMKTISDIPRFFWIFPKFWQWKLPVCRPERWIYLCLMLPLNGFLIYYSLEADFALYPLIVLMANFGLNFAYYFAMKVAFGEFGCSWKSIQVFMYLILALGYGGFSVYLKIPNLSGDDGECEYFSPYPYYDYHDAYQMLSAHALFFVFMTLLSIDDGVEGIDRDFLLLF